MFNLVIVNAVTTTFVLENRFGIAFVTDFAVISVTAVMI